MNKQIISKNKSTFHYLDYGTDKQEIILCLHGYADSATTFTEFGKLLSHEYRIIALDFPMLYSNDKIYGLDSLTEYVDEFVNTLNLQKFNLIGFSLGGLIAINYAFNYQSKINKLLLLNTSPVIFRFKIQLKLFSKIKPLLTTIKFTRAYAKLNTNTKIRNILKTPSITQENISYIQKNFLSVFGTLFNILDSSLIEKFNSLTVTKTIIFLKDDEVIKFKKYQKFLISLKGTIIIFEKGGHASKENYWKQIVSLLF